MGKPPATSKVWRALASLYAAAKPGRTGQGERDFQIDFRDLLREADCEDGDARAEAIRDLLTAEAQGIIQLDRHRRDRDLIEKARLPLANETRYYALLGESSPTSRRSELAARFARTANTEVPARWRQSWTSYLTRLTQAAGSGESVAPFLRDDLALTDELLALLPRLLDWEGESLIRFVSCSLCGNSKRLGELASRIGRILADLSNREITNLEMLGILESPRSVLMHGPLRLVREDQSTDLSALCGAIRLSEKDLAQADQVETTALRCLTVENETTFHELAKLQAGLLLVCTSFPGSGTLTLLRRLPDTLEFWHFGDTDPAGFEILRDLRERTGRPFKSLHMQFRDDPAAPLLTAEEKRSLQRLLDCPSMRAERDTLRAILLSGCKGRFEQESLGRPDSRWPFYQGA